MEVTKWTVQLLQEKSEIGTFREHRSSYALSIQDADDLSHFVKIQPKTFEDANFFMNTMANNNHLAKAFGSFSVFLIE
jgi:hypothetical protein